MIKVKIIEFKTEDEYNDYMAKVGAKVRSDEILTKEEIDNFCFALPYHEKKNLSICDNDRFEYLYRRILDNGFSRPKLSNEQIIDYNLLLFR